MTARISAGAIAFMATVLVLPSLVAAQSAAPAGAGKLWLQAAMSYSQSDQRFAGPYRQGDLDYDGGRDVGDRIPISVDEDGGSFRLLSGSLTLQAGLTPRLTVGAYFPFWQSSLLALESIEVLRTGAGDLWTHAAYLLTPFAWRVKVAAVAELKIPLSRADFRVLSVPLSEGQTDVAAGAIGTWEVGRAQLSAGLRYRYRAPVSTTVGAVALDVKPGDELEAHAEFGIAALPSLWLSAGWRSTWARVARQRALALEWEPTERRRLHAVEAGVYWTFLRSPALSSQLALSTFARVPVAGADMLSGPLVMVGLAWQGQLWSPR